MNKYLIPTCIAAVIGVVGLLIVNEACGESTPIGETYRASYMYCGAYTGTGGNHHCSMWLTGTELRQDTKVKGLFFDTTSYRVVR